MNDDGTMARLPDLMAFAQLHGLKIGTIADLIAYRRKHDSLVRAVEQKHIDDLYGAEFDAEDLPEQRRRPGAYRAGARATSAAPGPVLVRMHA